MNEITEKGIGTAIEVHKTIGRGLLESVFEECLPHEMRSRGLNFERQVPLPLTYKGVRLDCGYRMDALPPIQEAQLLTYLRLGGWPVGLLINFNVPVLRDGIKRIVLNCKDASASSAPLR